jgi:hypothetical protein
MQRHSLENIRHFNVKNAGIAPGLHQFNAKPPDFGCVLWHDRGIGFAAFMTAVISILIVVVGSAITVPPDRAFTIGDLGDQIEACVQN